MAPPAIRVRGIRTPIPSGYILGRTSPGTGDTELIDLGTIAALVAQSGQVAIPSSIPAGAASAITALTGDVTATGPGSATSLLVAITGPTTLPDSGVITAAGEVGLGGSPAARLEIGGTYTTANPNLMQTSGTLASSSTVISRLLNLSGTIAPSGASLSAINGILVFPTLNSTAFTIPAWTNVNSNITLGASFSGVITTGAFYRAGNPSISGGSITTIHQFFAVALTNGNGLSAGTATNNGFRVEGHSAGSAGGTVNNRGGFITVPTGGSTSGTTNNRGVYITGNGGTAAGGTVNNFAIYDDSTAQVYLAGGVSIGTTTDPGAGNLLVSSTIKAGGFTVATLPAAGTAGRRTYVTNALAPAFLVAVVGGGAVVTPVFDDGVNWVCG
jgi:hypothetical protein